MTTNISIRDFSRNINAISEYDYVEIEDKKSKEYKGLYVPVKYAKEIKDILDQKIAKEKKSKLDKIMKFAGIIDGDTNNQTAKEIKNLKSEKYNK